MFFQCSTEPFTIELDFLKKFIASCRYHYLRKYNIYGRHRLGWGFAYIPEHNNKSLIVKRDITPIYHSDWKNLANIKTRFLLVHARKTKPWRKSIKNVHPINIHEKFLIVHNGVIKKFPSKKLTDLKLEEIKKSTQLDTRKYLCHIIDKLNNNSDLRSSLESVFREITIGSSANAFLFNSQQCHVITLHRTNYKGRHHTLFIKKEKNRISVCTTPIMDNSKEIDNNSLISIDLNKLKLEFSKITNP
jgi:predicted glutamine amidotransferase